MANIGTHRVVEHGLTDRGCHFLGFHVIELKLWIRRDCPRRAHTLALNMLRTRAFVCHRAFVRAYATSPSPHALIFLEHRSGDIESGSLSALTAAGQLGGQVTGLVVGGSEEVKGVVEKAKKFVVDLSCSNYNY